VTIPREESWLDGDDGRLVRPYTVSNGRTRPSTRLNLTSMVQSAGGVPPAGLEPDHAHALVLCREPASVAELAHRLRLPAAVIKVLLSDLLDSGAMTTVTSLPSAPSAPGKASETGEASETGVARAAGMADEVTGTAVAGMAGDASETGGFGEAGGSGDASGSGNAGAAEEPDGADEPDEAGTPPLVAAAHADRVVLERVLDGLQRRL
jgi:hypothetical protein